MNTLLQMRQAVQTDLSVGDETTFFTPDVIDLAINRAKIKAEALCNWPALEDAQRTFSALQSDGTPWEYYDYPDNWRPNSIWKLEVDGEDYGEPLDFKSYQYEQQNGDPAGRDKKWANRWKQYFLDPAPTTQGLTIDIWGFKLTDDLVADGDETIFSYSMPECNLAIIDEAKAILKTKDDTINETQFFSSSAKQMLMDAYKRIEQNKAKSQSTIAFFKVPDFFATRRRGRRDTDIGDF